MKLRCLAAAAALVLAAPGATAHAAGPGAVDVSFGEAGQASGVLGGGATTLAGGLVQQSDGGIVAAGTYQVVRKGSTYPGQLFTAVARFTPEGQIDRRFGTEGWTLDDRFQVTARPAQQRDGKVVVPGGRLINDDGTARVLLGRYEADGTPDPAFGDDGVAEVKLPLPWAMPTAAEVDREGRIVLAIQGQEGAYGAGGQRFGLARLLSDGRPDRSFGTDGVALVDTSVGYRDAAAIALLPDGGIALAGASRNQESVVLLRFNGSGRAVRDWGDGGVMDLGFAGEVGELSVDRDDHLVLVGGIGTVPFPRTAVVLRFGLDGARDTGFGVGGVFSAKIGGSTDIGSSVLQPDGKRVVAGGFFKPRTVSAPPGGSLPPEVERPGTTGWALMRLRADGKLDRSFGNDGRVTSPLGPAFSHVQDLIRQDDGRYVAGGTATGCGGATLTLVRYHGDDTGAGQPDPGPIVRPCPGEAPVDTSGIELTIACPLVEQTCEGDIVLDVPVSQYLEAPAAGARAARSSRTVRVAAARYRTAGNRRQTLRVRLSPQGRRMVKRGRRFRATARIVSRDRRGKRRATATRVLVAPKRP
jgi:uncharacterized delta-60 repeat protein